MTRNDVLRTLIVVLNDIQRSSGQEVVDISLTSYPIGDLPGFDSLNGAEATAELSSRLGVDLPGVTVFADQKGRRALHVSEIVDNIYAACAARGG